MKPQITTQARLIDVAREAGVSRQTAGAVLLGGRTNTRASADTVRRVQEAAQRLNYHPNNAARQLKGLSTGVVGVLCQFLREPTHSLIVADLVEILTQRGYTVALGSFTENAKSLDEQVTEMARRGLDGMICVDERFLRRPKSLHHLLSLCPRTVLYASGHSKPGIGTHFVDVDRYQAARLAVRHLAGLGRRRIALFGGGPRWDWESQKKRLAGYRDELKSLGHEIDESLIFMAEWSQWHGGEPPLVETRGLIEEAIEHLVLRGGADALISGVVPAPMTTGLLLGLQARGFGIPDQIALMAIRDDPVYQYIHPTVTVVELHHDAVALPMVQMLEQMLTDDAHLSTRGNILVVPELIIRQSA